MEFEDEVPGATLLEENPEEELIDSDAMDTSFIEQAVMGHVVQIRDDSRANMMDEVTEWGSFFAMYRGDFEPEGDDDSFKGMNIPKLAKIVDILLANMSNGTIPEKTIPDFFSLVPQVESGDLAEMGDVDQFCKLAEKCIQNDLINSDFVEEYEKALLNLLITGNMWMLAVYDQTVKYRYQKEVNPEYDEQAGPEGNLVPGPNGAMRVRDKFIKRRVPIIEYDAPRMRSIHPMNVYPSELDRDNGNSCSGICIRDTCYYSDLVEGNIAEGGAIYANVDQLSPDDELDFISELDPFHAPAVYGFNSRASINVPKLERLTYFGKLDMKTLMRNIEIAPQKWMALFKKFNVDPFKADHWNTWIVEVINDRVIVRLQPVPHDKDEIPVVHHQLFRMQNCTLGWGIYKRCQYDERIYNYLNKLYIELTTRGAKPPIFMLKDCFDPEWLAEHGDKADFSPDSIWFGRNQAKVTEAYQPVPISWQPLAHIKEGMQEREVQMSEMTHLPFVKQGKDTTGADTATAVQAMNTNADNILDHFCQRLELEFLNRCINWYFALHAQYDEEPRVFWMKNPQNTLSMFNVPPEVWLMKTTCNIVGRRSKGSKAVQAMNMKEWVNSWQPSGVVNVMEACVEHAKMLDIAFAARLVKQPDPPQPEQPKMTAPVRLEWSQLPPEVQAQLLQSNGMEVSPDSMVFLTAMANTAMLNPDTDPTQTPGPPNTAPGSKQRSDDPNRSHHAAGEVERRQRGVHDAIGQMKTMGQLMRNPANGRRATA